VDVAALDPFRGYESAIDDIPEDAVHVVEPGTAAVDECRRCIQ
jgi:transposase